ncbi:hypothetical protein BDW67DRAFT_31585 [Aspergillus spinulosporus]
MGRCDSLSYYHLWPSCAIMTEETKASIEWEMGLFYLVFCFLYSRLGWDSDGMGHWGYEAFPTSFDFFFFFNFFFLLISFVCYADVLLCYLLPVNDHPVRYSDRKN